MTDIDESLSPESRPQLIQRVTLVVAIESACSLGATVVVFNSEVLGEWLLNNMWLLGVTFALALAIVVFFFVVEKERVRGALGAALLVLYIPLVCVIVGGYLPVLISPQSLLVGLSLLTTISALGWVFVQWQKPAEFKAHVVIPVGLMVSLGLYGGLLIAFHSIMTVHLMAWTFIEGGYIIYMSLDLQEISEDSTYVAADFASAAIRLYSDIVVFAISAFQSKSVGKGK